MKLNFENSSPCLVKSSHIGRVTYDKKDRNLRFPPLFEKLPKHNSTIASHVVSLFQTHNTWRKNRSIFPTSKVLSFYTLIPLFECLVRYATSIREVEKNPTYLVKIMVKTVEKRYSTLYIRTCILDVMMNFSWQVVHYSMQFRLLLFSKVVLLSSSIPKCAAAPLEPF